MIPEILQVCNNLLKNESGLAVLSLLFPERQFMEGGFYDTFLKNLQISNMQYKRPQENWRTYPFYKQYHTYFRLNRISTFQCGQFTIKGGQQKTANKSVHQGSDPVCLNQTCPNFLVSGFLYSPQTYRGPQRAFVYVSYICQHLPFCRLKLRKI